MRSICLGILAMLVLSILPALAQLSSGPISPTASAVPHRPMKFHRVRSDGTVESENWSGYAVTGSPPSQTRRGARPNDHRNAPS